MISSAFSHIFPWFCGEDPNFPHDLARKFTMEFPIPPGRRSGTAGREPGSLGQDRRAPPRGKKREKTEKISDYHDFQGMWAFPIEITRVGSPTYDSWVVSHQVGLFRNIIGLLHIITS